jgi:small GTP-binding protein
MQSYALKVCVVGDSQVGKSSICRRFTKKEFRPDAQPTTGLEFATRDIRFERCLIKAQIWDNASDSKEKIRKAFYKDCVGCIVTYSLDDKQSFDNVTQIWLDQIKSYGHEKIPIVLGKPSWLSFFYCTTQRSYRAPPDCPVRCTSHVSHWPTFMTMAELITYVYDFIMLLFVSRDKTGCSDG